MMTAIKVPPQQPATDPTPQEQASRLLAHAAGYVGHRTIAIGLRLGLVGALAEAAGPLNADDLAGRLGLDPFYVAVWCRAAHASGLCDRPDESGAASVTLGDRYRLAPQMAALLLDTGHPGYVGGVFTVLEQPEVFDRFEANLAGGQRLWWDGCSPAFIAGVAGTGMPFYTRLIPGGLARIPGLAARLDAGCRVVDIACGSGVGLARIATAYPNCEVIGVDGDQHSLAQAERYLADAGVADRCQLVACPLEELALDQPAALVVNNLAMHECRDIDRVTANVHAALEPGGWFVISDFPFPDTTEGLRSVPGRVLTGIQYFEAQIDDQLLPRTAYDDLLARHGFTDLDHFELSPVHAVTHARAW
jgi:SAM-dependent methyltransferase